jgi:hypothetical protein
MAKTLPVMKKTSGLFPSRPPAVPMKSGTPGLGAARFQLKQGRATSMPKGGKKGC